MLSAKYGWNWPCGSEEEDENVCGFGDDAFLPFRYYLPLERDVTLYFLRNLYLLIQGCSVPIK